MNKFGARPIAPNYFRTPIPKFLFKMLLVNVVFTNKRSQAEVFTVYFSLKYLECNNYNVHCALSPLT